MNVFDYSSYDRGTFACVGSDDRLHNVKATVRADGKLLLTLDDGRLLRRVMRGSYFSPEDRLRLHCDHPDAP